MTVYSDAVNENNSRKNIMLINLYKNILEKLKN
jgi:hypothetical protein